MPLKMDWEPSFCSKMTKMRPRGSQWPTRQEAWLSVSNAALKWKKELLTLVFGAERFHQCIYGATVQAETDHEPLVSLPKKPLNDCPLQAQCLLLCIQRHDLEVSYNPGM